MDDLKTVKTNTKNYIFDVLHEIFDPTVIAFDAFKNGESGYCAILYNTSKDTLDSSLKSVKTFPLFPINKILNHIRKLNIETFDKLIVYKYLGKKDFNNKETMIDCTIKIKIAVEHANRIIELLN